MWRPWVPPPCWEWRNQALELSIRWASSSSSLNQGIGLGGFQWPGRLRVQWHSRRIHFNITSDTFREWNCRRRPWGTFVYSGSAGVEIWIPGVQAKFWNPERLCGIPKRCPAFHGLPSLAGDGRPRARPLYSSFVDILWLSPRGSLADTFNKYIPLICVPKAQACGYQSNTCHRGTDQTQKASDISDGYVYCYDFIVRLREFTQSLSGKIFATLQPRETFP